MSTTAARRAAGAFNAAQMERGALTVDHVTELVRFWQDRHPGLTLDGKAGPLTIASIAEAIPADVPAAPASGRFLHRPLPALADGRTPVITSSFRPADRPNHSGCDLFYRWMPGDQPDFVGDKGCAGKASDGRPKWVVPYQVCAIAAANGVVTIAGPSPTGYRCWIDHGNGWRTGYFHLLDMRVGVGLEVEAGHELGLVGDNPIDHDGRHLHFELSSVSSYKPVDPEPYLLV